MTFEVVQKAVEYVENTNRDVILVASSSRVPDVVKSLVTFSEGRLCNGTTLEVNDSKIRLVRTQDIPVEGEDFDIVIISGDKPENSLWTKTWIKAANQVLNFVR